MTVAQHLWTGFVKYINLLTLLARQIISLFIQYCRQVFVYRFGMLQLSKYVTLCMQLFWGCWHFQHDKVA